MGCTVRLVARSGTCWVALVGPPVLSVALRRRPLEPPIMRSPVTGESGALDPVGDRRHPLGAKLEPQLDQGAHRDAVRQRRLEMRRSPRLEDLAVQRGARA